MFDEEPAITKFYGLIVSVPAEQRAHVEAVMARIGIRGHWEATAHGIATYQDTGTKTGPVIEWTLTLDTEDDAFALLESI